MKKLLMINRTIMKRLQKRVNELEKEINLTSLIIQMIEQERVLTIEEKRSKIIHVLDAKKDDLG